MVPPIRLAARDQEAVVRQDLEGVPFVGTESADRIGGRDAAVKEGSDVAGNQQLSVGQRVHQKHFVARWERHTKVEHRRLHDRLNSDFAFLRDTTRVSPC